MTPMFALLGMGGGEIVLVLVVVLLLFGPKKLPELAKGLGKGIREFKKASNEVTQELERAAEEPPAPRKTVDTAPKVEDHSHSDSAHAVPHSPGNKPA